MASLIPRPSYHPVFDQFWYMRKRSGNMSSINVCVARQKEREALLKKGIWDTCVGVLNDCEEGKNCLSFYRMKSACVKHNLSLKGPSPLFILIQLTWQIVSGLLPLFMHTVSNQIVDIWKAWEWEYALAMHVVSIENTPQVSIILTGVEVMFQTHTRSTISIYLHLPRLLSPCTTISFPSYFHFYFHKQYIEHERWPPRPWGTLY